MYTTTMREDSLVRHANQLEDRKSTRLNSSHSQISYAVFCLKKKNELYSLSSPPSPLPVFPWPGLSHQRARPRYGSGDGCPPLCQLRGSYPLCLPAADEQVVA